jgi:putative ATPase
MRPISLDEVVGQDQLLGEGAPLRLAIARGELPSMILWGPPGCGKTTLGRCLAAATGNRFLAYSAVRVGVKELKGVMDEASKLRRVESKRPILFLDEIHRFNKAQQDALLPHVEAGDVTLVGATTENPSFEVNAALLSRSRVFVLEALGEAALITVLRHALESERGLAASVMVDDEALVYIAQRCGGDARFALTTLELAAHSLEAGEQQIDVAQMKRVLASSLLVHDKAGEEHFNLISALHKSMRNSDAQGSLYWLARLLEAGEDPMYVVRRLIRFASEDIGLADPSALLQCVAAGDAVRNIGLPEAKLAIAQAALYCAQSPKSNAVYTGYAAAAKEIANGSSEPVPLHLRNAPTSLMKDLGYGHGYRYAHDEESGVAEMECLPDALRGRIYYRPTERGFEAEAAERLRAAWLRAHRGTRSDDDGPAS